MDAGLHDGDSSPWRTFRRRTFRNWCAKDKIKASVESSSLAFSLDRDQPHPDPNPNTLFQSSGPNPPLQPSKDRRWSMSWVLTVPFVLLSSISVVTVGTLSLINGEQAVDDLADRLHLQLQERLRVGLENYFARPKQAAHLLNQALQSRLVDPSQLTQVGQFAWQLRQTFDLSYVNYGLATGEFAGAGTGRKGIALAERSAALGWRYEEYAADANGRRLQRVDTFAYDHRNEAWYQAAVKLNRPTWSEIYAWDGTPEFVSINYAMPIRDRQGQPIGAVGVDILLDHINAILKEQKIHPQLQMAVVERNGRLVGSTDNKPLFSEGTTASNGSNSLKRLTIATSGDALLQAALQQVNQRGGLPSVQQPTVLPLIFKGQPYILWASPWRDRDGLDWVVLATLPKTAFMERIDANRKGTVLLCALVVTLAIFIGLVTARKLSMPVQTLAIAARQLAAGNLDRRTEPFSIRELNDLSNAFNRMADELRTSLTALGQSNQSLESRVSDRTAALAQALSDLKSAQTQLIQTEKMSGLGQMVAGIAHEINNPVAFIHGNLGMLRQYTHDLVKWMVALGLSQADRNNPDHVGLDPREIDPEEVAFVLDDLPRLIESMEEGTRRIEEIVSGLRNFSRLDQVDRKAASVHDGLDSTLTILTHRLRRTGSRPPITVQKHYEPSLPMVWCYPGQLNQVFMNLLANAIDALDEAWVKGLFSSKGEATDPTITLTTRLLNHNLHNSEDPQVEIAIADNGVGIPDSIRGRLFDPFFTTKPVGKGTGLGLAIAYQIVTSRHQGQITCQSILGQGSQFMVTLPLGGPSSDPVAPKDNTAETG
ncbi:MAG: sensor histidine kinase [Oscillatoriales cyanobacterium]|nr:MAG: sensor histidine kinase [Oscillatoriales cyanobacterium]